MIEEGLAALVDLVRKSQDVRIVQVPGEADHVYGVLDNDTRKLDWRNKQPRPRDHQLFTLPDFVAAVKAFRRRVKKARNDKELIKLIEAYQGVKRILGYHH